MRERARERWRILKFLAARALCVCERRERAGSGGMRNFGQESDAAAEITLLCMSCVDQARPDQARSHLHYESARTHASVRDALGISIAAGCDDG